MYDVKVPFHQIADHNFNIIVRMFVNYLDVIRVVAILMVFPLFPMLSVNRLTAALVLVAFRDSLQDFHRRPTRRNHLWPACSGATAVNKWTDVPRLMSSVRDRSTQDIFVKVRIFCGERWSNGYRAPAFRSRGRWFDSTSAVSMLGQFRSPHFACVFQKRQ